MVKVNLRATNFQEFEFLDLKKKTKSAPVLIIKKKQFNTELKVLNN